MGQGTGLVRGRVWARLMPLAALLMLFVLSRALATQAPLKPPGADYTGEAFTFTRIQDGIYHAVGTGRLSVGCNASIIVNPEDVIVVDSHISPAAGWALQQELKNITPKPIRYVVNTHWHFDHVHGNQAFPREAEIIGHEFTREMVAAGRSKAGRSYELFVGGLPDQIARLEQRIAATTDAGERAKLQEQLAVQRNHLTATGTVVPVPPTITVSQTMTVHRGGRDIRLLFLGRAHTGGEVVVHLPKERLLIAGDLLTEGISYIGDSYPLEWLETLDRVKRLEFDTVLPGHGQAFRGKEKFDHFQGYLKDFWQQAKALHDAGVSAEDAAARMDMRSHASHYPSITAAGVMSHGVQRVYELLEGRAR